MTEVPVCESLRCVFFFFFFVLSSMTVGSAVGLAVFVVESANIRVVSSVQI